MLTKALTAKASVFGQRRASTGGGGSLSGGVGAAEGAWPSPYDLPTISV